MGIKDAILGVLNSATGNLIGGAIDIIKKSVKDKDLAAQLEAQLETLRATQEHEDQMAAVQLLLGQIETNKVEAANTSIFVAGWRPAVGWVCCFGIAYAFIVHPLAIFIAYLFGFDLSKLPPIDVASLLSLVLSMLGVASLRSYDKKQGTDTVSVSG